MRGVMLLVHVALAALLLTVAADPMDDALRATLEDAVSAFGVDYDATDDAGLADVGSAATDSSDRDEGIAAADNTVSLSAPAAVMRQTLDDVLTLGDDVDADRAGLDDEPVNSSPPPGTRPTGKHSAKLTGSEDCPASRPTNAPKRRRLALDPPAPGAFLDAESEGLWLRATTSFENGEYIEALPAWQELAAGVESSNSRSNDATNLPLRASAAFNLALTYEQLGA
eukprot:COSAG02_NODE_220_length_28426_cov_28.546863_11_plen_226_part_00